MLNSKSINNTIILSRRLEIIIISLIFFVALAVRIKDAWPALNGTQGFVTVDDESYYRLALSLLNTGRLQDGNIVAFRMPVFPILLAIIIKLFGTAPQNATAFIVYLSALICVGTYFLGKIVFNPFIGIAAGLIIAFDIDLIFYTRYLNTEIPFVFIVLCSFLILERFKNSPSALWAILLGLSFGLATLTRVNFGFFVPFALAYIYIYTKPFHKNMIVYIGLTSCIVLSMWLLWVVRNYIELGAFVPFTTQVGNAYYGVYNDISANNHALLGFGVWIDIPIPQQLSSLNEVDRDSELGLIAGEWIKAHPIVAFQMAFSQVFHLWRPEFIGSAGIPYILILFASVVGLIKTIPKKIFQIRIWILLMICFSIFAFISIGISRFIVVFHPFMAILAAFAMVYLNRVFLNKIGYKKNL